MTTTALPEQGQLVQVRSRPWVVNQIKPSSLPTPAMQLPNTALQHLLTLASVEDDGLGEELQVIWEIEPGAKVVEKVALPDPSGFDSPEKLDAFLDAVRWGAASTADVKNIQSPFRSGIEIEDYQLDPVAEVWAEKGRSKLQRVAARVVPNEVLDTPAVIAHVRLVVIGGDSFRLHEEIIATGGFIKDQKWGTRLNVGQTESALVGATSKEPSTAVKAKLLELYPTLTSSLASALESRMKQMVDGLQKKLAERTDKEAKDIESILTELKKSIEAELKDPVYIQPMLEGFDDPEKERFERNKDAMRARAKGIPEEIKRETAAIRARFANPQARMFPVAVTFLVPEKMAI